MMAERAMMKALVYEGPRELNMRTVPVPSIQPDEVLVRVRVAGICGSELSGYLGLNSLRKPPLIMGHEFSGVIEKVGEQVTGFVPGDRVVVNPLVTCGHCRSCRTGESQRCSSRALLGAHRPGAFAEFTTVSAENLYKLPDHVSDEAGSFVEPFACAVHICRMLGLTPTDRLVIYGAGPIGLFTLQAAQQYGLTDIAVIDLNEARLAIARKLGAQTATQLELLEDQHSSDAGFDAAVDAVGAGITRLKCITATRPGGTVIFTGLHEADSMLPVNDMIRSEITTIGAFAYSREDFETALQWILQDRVSLLPWTQTVPLQDGKNSFETLLHGPGELAKFLLKIE